MDSIEKNSLSFEEKQPQHLVNQSKGLVIVGVMGVVLALLISLLVWKYFGSSRTSGQTVNTKISNQTKQTVPTPTPIPFVELTIPYLRSKEYKSSLANLTRVSSNASYTSYLTSYTSDGLKINGLLTQPTGSKPEGGWPAIVFIHGYLPPTTYQTTGASYSAYVDYLASNGFVVFKIDLRGHGSSEGEPGGAYYSSDYVIDALNAYAALQSTDFVNPNKIGLWGHSMAGNVVMRSFAAKPEIPAVVVWAGAGFSYLDLNTYGIDDNSYRPPPNDAARAQRRQELMKTYGNPKDGNPFWKLVAPTSYLNDLKGSVNVHHAVDDAVVSVEYGRELNRLLDQTSVEHRLYEYSSGGHNISGSSFNTAMQRTVEFFKQNLNDQ